MYCMLFGRFGGGSGLFGFTDADACAGIETIERAHGDGVAFGEAFGDFDAFVDAVTELDVAGVNDAVVDDVSLVRART